MVEEQSKKPVELPKVSESESVENVLANIPQKDTEAVLEFVRLQAKAVAETFTVQKFSNESTGSKFELVDGAKESVEKPTASEAAAPTDAQARANETSEQRSKRFSTLLEASDYRGLNDSQQKQLGNWLEQHKEQLKQGSELDQNAINRLDLEQIYKAGKWPDGTELKAEDFAFIELIASNHSDIFSPGLTIDTDTISDAKKGELYKPTSFPETKEADGSITRVAPNGTTVNVNGDVTTIRSRFNSDDSTLILDTKNGTGKFVMSYIDSNEDKEVIVAELPVKKNADGEWVLIDPQGNEAKLKIAPDFSSVSVDIGEASLTSNKDGISISIGDDYRANANHDVATFADSAELATPVSMRREADGHIVQEQGKIRRDIYSGGLEIIDDGEGVISISVRDPEDLKSKARPDGTIESDRAPGSASIRIENGKIQVLDPSGKPVPLRQSQDGAQEATLENGTQVTIAVDGTVHFYDSYKDSDGKQQSKLHIFKLPAPRSTQA